MKYAGFDRTCCGLSNIGTDCIYTGRKGSCRFINGYCKVARHNLYHTCNHLVPVMTVALTRLALVQDSLRLEVIESNICDRE